jgi:hypothetical protein
MLTSLIALCALAPPPMQAPAANPSPAALVSKMIARYAEAKTVVGTITFVNSASGRSVRIDTQLQLERPSRLFLRQATASQPPQTWLVTSDGEFFSYDRPEGLLGRAQRLIEPVKAGDQLLKVADIYSAAGGSLADRSPPLDLAIGRLVDLQALRNSWATLEYKGRTTFRGATVHVVAGQHRDAVELPASGTFEMLIGDDGDLLRYTHRNIVAAPREYNVAPIEVTAVWDADLKVNGPVDPNLFRVVR